MLVVTKNRTKCAVCVDLQAVGALEFFGELYSLAKGFGPFLRGFGQALEKGRVLFLVTTSILPSLRVACPLPASRVDKPLTIDSIVPGVDTKCTQTRMLCGELRIHSLPRYFV